MIEQLTTIVTALGDTSFILLDHGSALDHWAKAQFHEALETRIRVVMGMAAFMMIVGVAGYLALYNWSKSFTVPTVALVLSGGFLVAMLPGVVARIAWIIILLAGSLGLFGLLWGVLR